jgi:hypothetical protein
MTSSNPRPLQAVANHIVVALALLNPKELEAVMANVNGDAAAIRAAVSSIVHQEYVLHFKEEVPAPYYMTDPSDLVVWHAIVRDGRDGMEVVLEDRLPEHVAKLDANGAKAANKREKLLHRKEEIAYEREDLSDAREKQLDQGEHATTEDYDKSIFWKRLALTGIVVVEGGGLLGANLSAAGVTSYPSLGMVPGQVWSEVILTSLGTGFAYFALPHLSRVAVKRGYSPWVCRSLSVLAYGGFLGVAVALSYQRAHLPGMHTNFVTQGLVAIGLVAAGIAADVVYTDLEALGREREKCRRTEQRFHETMEALAREEEEIDEQIKAADHDIEACNSLRSDYERGVTVAKDLFKREERETDERVEAALGLHAHLSELSKAERENLLRQVYKLQERERHDGEPASASTRKTAGRRFRDFAGGLLVLAALGPGLEGCSQPIPPAHVVVICDGTGEDPGAVCTSGYLEREATRFCSSYALSAGSTFTLVFSSGAFATTPTSVPYVSPDVLSVNANDAEEACKRAVLEHLDFAMIPSDQNSTGNQSNLIAALLVGAQSARNHEDGAAHLRLSSDGLHIGYGLDVEHKTVPTAADVLRRLEGERVTLNLSMFDNAEWCGATNIGLSANRAQARDTLVKGLLLEAGIPNVRVKSTCSGDFR